jgi:hypothetical protein
MQIPAGPAVALLYIAAMVFTFMGTVGERSAFEGM